MAPSICGECFLGVSFSRVESLTVRLGSSARVRSKLYDTHIAAGAPDPIDFLIHHGGACGLARLALPGIEKVFSCCSDLLPLQTKSTPTVHSKRA